jgi:hypothetical protein
MRTEIRPHRGGRSFYVPGGLAHPLTFLCGILEVRGIVS